MAISENTPTLPGARRKPSERLKARGRLMLPKPKAKRFKIAEVHAQHVVAVWNIRSKAEELIEEIVENADVVMETRGATYLLVKLNPWALTALGEVMAAREDLEAEPDACSAHDDNPMKQHSQRHGTGNEEDGEEGGDREGSLGWTNAVNQQGLAKGYYPGEDLEGDAREDMEDDDPGGGNVEDQPHDPETDIGIDDEPHDDDFSDGSYEAVHPSNELRTADYSPIFPEPKPDRLIGVMIDKHGRAGEPVEFRCEERPGNMKVLTRVSPQGRP